MYSTLYSSEPMKKHGEIYGIKNVLGNIEVSKFDCFKRFKDKTSFYFKPDPDRDDYYTGLEKENFCTPLPNRYRVDRENNRIDFVHTDKNILISKWNEQIENDKLSCVPLYKYENKIKSFADFITLAETFKKKGLQFKSVVIRVHDLTQAPIKISLTYEKYEKDEEDEEDEDAEGYYFLYSDFYENKFEKFVKDCEWDEGYSGYATMEEIDNYLAAYPLDIARCYFLECTKRTEEELNDYAEENYGNFKRRDDIKSIFLTFDILLNGAGYNKNAIYLLDNFEYEEGYVYELMSDKNEFDAEITPYIVAYKIISETETEWICEGKTFVKKNFENKVNPLGIELFYGLSPEEVIGLYNDNLDKFKI